MSRGGDPRRLVHVLADVAVLRQVRSARVDAHAHLDRPLAERLLRLPRRRERARCCREGDEERIALRVDLHAAVAREGRPQDAAVLGERPCIPLRAELVQQLGRPLDVREEEADGAGRKVAHGLMIHQR